MIATTETLQVPAGTGVKDSSRKTDLLYNEYIVYDVAQVYLFTEDKVKNCLCEPNIPVQSALALSPLVLSWHN